MADTEDISKRERLRERLLRSLPKGARVAEIGVWEGAFSRRILDVCQPAELHLIDPWLYQPAFGNTGFGRKKNEFLMEQKYQDVMAAFRDTPAVRIHRATSEVALSALPDGYLDWVYIDGNHNEPFIGQDIALCLRKVKPNGHITGDDFNWQTEASGAPVKRAVEAAVAELGARASLRLMANQYVIAPESGLTRPATFFFVARLLSPNLRSNPPDRKPRADFQGACHLGTAKELEHWE